MYVFGVDANIMSLAGLAIAIGDVGDMGIIMTENIYRHVATADEAKSHFQKVFEGASEVGGAIVTAVSNTLVSFIPVFFLTGQEGKLFRPLAFTKTFAIGASVMLALTVVPLLCYLPVPSGDLVEADGVDHRRGARPRCGVRRARGFHVGDCGGPLQRLADVGGRRRDRRTGLCAHHARAVPAARGEPRLARRRQRLCPELRWILAHKKTFLIVPVAILFTGLTIWLGIGRRWRPWVGPSTGSRARKLRPS